jgi:guanyl-specific ribonuclease Sa
LAYGFYTAQQRKNAPQAQPNRPVNIKVLDAPAASERVVVENVAVQYEDHGRIVTWRGDVDLTATIDRIRRGERLEQWENDGASFGNHEKHLPPHPRGYYREWVHPTPGAPGPGPQRVISGSEGDFWYTPDHYASFIELEHASTGSH